MKNSSHRTSTLPCKAMAHSPSEKKGDPHCSNGSLLCAWHCHYLWQCQHNFYHCCTLPTQHKSLIKYILSHIYQIDWTQLQQVLRYIYKICHANYWTSLCTTMTIKLQKIESLTALPQCTENSIQSWRIRRIWFTFQFTFWKCDCQTWLHWVNATHVTFCLQSHCSKTYRNAQLQIVIQQVIRSIYENLNILIWLILLILPVIKISNITVFKKPCHGTFLFGQCLCFRNRQNGCPFVDTCGQSLTKIASEMILQLWMR